VNLTASTSMWFRSGLIGIISLMISACASSTSPSSTLQTANQLPAEAPNYLIGPGDVLKIFVWQNPDLSVTVPVRPDGRISIPLIQDLTAAQKTPTQLAADITKGLETYIRSPVVTVIVTDFVGPYSEQVRVMGEATKPQAISYRANMSVLDVMIAVGGLTPFAAGDRAVIARRSAGEEQQIPVRLDALLKDGDLSANVPMKPGDILIIPKSWF
jgi:polysaccharide export outer membrane protein